jgi:phage pi2 protein 07
MKKQFTILLIIAFVFSLIPNNITQAITQNQINAEVQIVCTDGRGDWFSGSGTIIDPKGIILTNKHVVDGAYMNICFIGFIKSISQEPDFGTKDNPNLAEVKYKTTSDSMDAAILYLNNPNNVSYPYVDIWNSNSDSLSFGDKLEVVGYPSIGGSTITYTSGDFSGFGSKTENLQNYIKATVPLEHGNSGGAAYNPKGQYIGIPSLVIAGSLNSISYILSINSIKKWLSSILGNSYKQEVITQKPIIEQSTINIQNDITPPNISKVRVDFYDCSKHYTKKDANGVSMSDKYPLYPNDCVVIPDTNNKNYNIDVEFVYIKTYVPDEVLNDVYDFDSESSNNPNNYKLLSQNKDRSADWERQSVLTLLWRPMGDYTTTTNIGGFHMLTQYRGEGVYYYSMQFYDKSGNASEVRTWRYSYSKSPNNEKLSPQTGNIDINLSKKLNGKLLLQVEQGGAIWYVDTKEYKRYSVTWANALPLFRKLSLGITDANLAKIPIAESRGVGDWTLRNQLKGKLLLQVEQGGSIWYVDQNGYRYSVTWGNLMDLFKKLALGITDANLAKIQIGSLD